MKKRFLKIICSVMLLCSFFLTGCMGGDASSIEAPSDDLTSTVNDADNIMKTANNLTYYYDNLVDLQKEAGLDAVDRNSLVSLFSDAYLFIDPGAEHEYADHYTKTSYPFYQLVDRQVDTMAQILSKMILSVYGTVNHTSIDGTSIDFKGATTGIVNPNDAMLTRVFAVSSLDTIGIKSIDLDGDGVNDILGTDDIGTTLNLNNIATLGALANVVTNSTATSNVDTYKVVTVTVYDTTDSSKTADVEINANLLNFSKAIFGGRVVKAQTYSQPEIAGVSEAVTGIYADFDDTELNTGDRFVWNFVNNYGASSSGTDAEIDAALYADMYSEMKYRIATALAGVEDGSEYNQTKYVDLLKQIDHLGITSQDQANIATQILKYTIGEKVVNNDNSYVQKINEYFGYLDDSLVIPDTNISDIQNLFNIDSTDLDAGGNYIHDEEFQNYKAYDKVIGALVRQSVTAVANYIEGEDPVVGETIFPSFPRLQLVIIDARSLMDAVGYEEENGDSSDYEEIDPDDIPTDTEGVEFAEKLSQLVNLKAIMFLPKQVVGERTMAVKDGDTWVVDEDDEQVYETFIVEGFMLTDVDVVLMAGDSNKAVVQGNYTVKTKNTQFNVQSEAFEVGYEKPDPTVEETYSSTAMIDIDKQELIQKKEDEIGGYRIFGYNGLSISEEGIISNGTGLPIEIASQGTMGDYKTYTFGTSMYKYFGAGSVVGEGAGYSLDINNFAGENYVLVDFSVLEVNGDTSNRKVDLNILYLSCETA